MSAILRQRTIFDEIGKWPLSGLERYRRVLDRFYIAEIGLEMGCPECDCPVNTVCVAIPRRSGFQLLSGKSIGTKSDDPDRTRGEVLLRPCECVVPLRLFDVYMHAYLGALGEGDDQT